MPKSGFVGGRALVPKAALIGSLRHHRNDLLWLYADTRLTVNLLGP